MPLSDERVAEMREWLGGGHGLTFDEGCELLAAYDDARAEVERLTEKVMNIDAWVERVAPKYESKWEDPAYRNQLLYKERDEALDRADEAEAEVERLRAQVEELDGDNWQKAAGELADLVGDLERERDILRAHVAAVESLLQTDGVARHPSKTVRVGEIRAALASAGEVRDAG